MIVHVRARPGHLMRAEPFASIPRRVIPSFWHFGFGLALIVPRPTPTQQVERGTIRALARTM